jgi:hypothetical protein
VLRSWRVQNIESGLSAIRGESGNHVPTESIPRRKRE